MSGGAAVAAIPVAGEDTDDALPRSTALRKKSDISKKDEDKCTCPDACEVHPKAKEPMQKSKEFFNPTKTTVGTV